MKLTKLFILLIFSIILKGQTPKPGSGGNSGGSSGITGNSCPSNQTAVAISNTGALTCVTLTSSYMDTSVLKASNNLSDIGNFATTRGNLGISNFNLCAVDGAGNFSCPGSLSGGVGSGIAGVLNLPQGTLPTFGSNTFSIYAPTSISTSYRWLVPSSDPGAGVVYSDGGVTPSNITTIAVSGTGSIVRANGASIGTPTTLGLANALGLPAGGLASVAADNIFGNFSSSSAVPSTQAIPACPADGTHAITYPSHTITCTAITGSGGSSPGSSVFNITTPITVTSTSTTSLLGGAQTIPTGYFITSTPVDIAVGGVYTLPATYLGTATLAVFVDGSQVATTGALTVTSTAVSNGAWKADCQLTTYTTGVSGTYILNCPVVLMPSSTATTAVSGGSLTIASANTFDTTASHTVDFKWTWSSTTGSPSITSQYGTATVGGAPVVSVSIDGGSAQTGNVTLTSKVTSVNTLTGNVALFATNSQTATYTTTTSDFSACKVIPVASGTFTITLVASGSQPPTGQCVRILNYGTGVVGVAPNGQNINGSGSSLTLAAGSPSAPTGVLINSDGANYEAQPFVSGGGSGGGFAVHPSIPTFAAYGTFANFNFDGSTSRTNNADNSVTISRTSNDNSGTIRGYTTTTIPSTPYTITTAFRVSGFMQSAAALSAGIVVIASGKALTCSAFWQSNSLPGFDVGQWSTSTGAESGHTAAGNGLVPQGLMYLQFVITSSSSMTCQTSADGFNYTTIGIDTTFLGATPSAIGVYMLPGNSGVGFVNNATFYGFSAQ